MIHPELVRYTFDETGTNPDNLVRNEAHTLANKKYRAISPYHGIFYTDSLVITDVASEQILIKGKDYVFAELHQDLTRHTGKEIAGLAIVINQSVSGSVRITYQCVGGPYSVNADTAISLLEKVPDDTELNSWYDIINKPSTVPPTPHMHDLGDVANMDVLLYGLERLRSVLLWSVNTSVQSIIQLTIGAIDSHIANIFSTADTEYINMLIDLRNSIIENGVGLDKVANLPLAVISDDEDKREDKDFLDDNTVIVHTDHDKYVATQVLSYIKEKLYSELITRVDTAIDYKTTEYETNALGMTTAIDVPIGMSIDRIMKEDEELTPKILDRLGQGTTFILYPLATSLAKYPRVDKTVYPSDKDTSVYWAITKIAEVPDGKGSVLLGTNMSTGELYGARLRVNNVGAVSISWDPFIWDNVPKVEYDPVTGKPIYNEVLPFAALFREHINDFNNPHKVRKIQTQLGLVENLPVATKSDIISSLICPILFLLYIHLIIYDILLLSYLNLSKIKFTFY